VRERSSSTKSERAILKAVDRDVPEVGVMEIYPGRGSKLRVIV
jgi:hypothetical protein